MFNAYLLIIIRAFAFEEGRSIRPDGRQLQNKNSFGFGGGLFILNSKKKMSGSRTAAASPSSNDDGCNSDEEPLMLDKVEDREAQADDTRLISAPHFWLWFEHRLQKKYYRDIDKLLVYVKPPLVVFKEIKILIQEIGSLVSPPPSP